MVELPRAGAVMLPLFPVALGAGLMWLLLRPQIVRARCPALAPDERAAFDWIAGRSDVELVEAAARANAGDKAAVVSDLYVAADKLGARGCTAEAAHLRARAGSVARLPDVSPRLLMPTTGQDAAPSWTPSPVWSPPAPPGTSPAPASMPAPADATMPELPIGQPVIAVMYCSGQRCWVRPEPRAWDDTQGRFGFSIPNGYRVDVTSFGPPGWARVELDHPDHGRVPGYVELAHVSTDAPRPAAVATPAAATAGMRPPPGGLLRPSSSQKKRAQARKRARQARRI